jgi:hypothetical protein
MRSLRMPERRLGEMKRLRLCAVALASLSAIGACTVTGVARADPSTSTTLTYHFTGCSGPAGTPTIFDAVKQPSEAAAVHLTSGSGTFIFIEAVDVATGTVLFTTPGFTHNNLPTITCSLIHPVTHELVRVTGFIAPVG